MKLAHKPLANSSHDLPTRNNNIVTILRPRSHTPDGLTTTVCLPFRECYVLLFALYIDQVDTSAVFSAVTVSRVAL